MAQKKYLHELHLDCQLEALIHFSELCFGEKHALVYFHISSITKFS